MVGNAIKEASESIGVSPVELTSVANIENGNGPVTDTTKISAKHSESRNP